MHVFVIDDPVDPDLAIPDIMPAKTSLGSPDLTTVFNHRTALGAQDCCVVDFEFTDHTGAKIRMPDVAVGRTHPESPDFFLWDLRKGARPCRRCSILLVHPVSVTDPPPRHDGACNRAQVTWSSAWKVTKILC